MNLLPIYEFREIAMTCEIASIDYESYYKGSDHTVSSVIINAVSLMHFTVWPFPL